MHSFMSTLLLATYNVLANRFAGKETTLDANIARNEQSAQHIVNLITSNECCVICLQEVESSFVTCLKGSLNGTAEVHFESHDQSVWPLTDWLNKKPEYIADSLAPNVGTAIVYKLPHTQECRTECIAFSGGFKASAIRVPNLVHGNTCLILSVHVEVAENKAVHDQHLQQLEKLLEQDNVICGANLNDNGLSFHRFVNGDRLATYPAQNPTCQLDAILHSQNLTTGPMQLWQTGDVSDHLGVTCTLGSTPSRGRCGLQ